MTRAELLERASSAAPALARVALGCGGIACVLAGVWGLWGWEWAAIAGGALPATFYIYGEARAARGPREETD